MLAVTHGRWLLHENGDLAVNSEVVEVVSAFFSSAFYSYMKKEITELKILGHNHRILWTEMHKWHQILTDEREGLGPEIYSTMPDLSANFSTSQLPTWHISD